MEDIINKKRKNNICMFPKRSHAYKNFITKIDENAFINIVPTISAWGKEDGLQVLRKVKKINIYP